MTILGSLSIRGLWDGRKLDSGISKSRKRTKQMTSSLGGLKTAMAGLGIGVTIAGIQRFASAQFDAIDSLAKTSRRLGLTTETLGAYQYAAGLSGLETETLNTSLEKMRDTIGAAAMGEGGATKALTALGLDPNDLAAAQNPLEKIQTAIGKIGDQNQKLAIVRDIFGRGGAQILNLYENNLAGLRKEYERLGLAVSSEEAARVEKFNDKLSILSQRFASVGRNLLIDATPVALEALGGAQIILEAVGAIKGQPTAKEKAKAASDRLRGITPNVGVSGIGGARGAIVDFVAEAAAGLFENQEVRARTARAWQARTPGEVARQAQYRQPQINNQPVYLNPSPMQ